MKTNIAILGYGYWGPNLVRNFNKFSNCNISYIVDRDRFFKGFFSHVNNGTSEEITVFFGTCDENKDA